MADTEYRYLYRVDSPADLRRLTPDELAGYCAEVRRYLIEQCSSNPGHLASSLGSVELAVALHYVFATPDDRIVWDVGHQAYAHKIITGRRDAFPTNRRLGGLAGFPRPSESPFDAFIGGHSSVSISAALGMAQAARLKGERRHAVAVIGDGAMTGGLAFEGLNNAGALQADVLVVLNDNHMSIEENVGALSEYLLRFTTSRRYNKLKSRVWTVLAPLPWLRRALQRTGNALKQGLLQNSNLFESFGFRYFGPVDGHDVRGLIRTLGDLKAIRGPKLLHVYTVKGKGYAPAEHAPTVWHAPGRYDPRTGERLETDDDGRPARFQTVFGETLVDLALLDERVVGVTPAMPSGCSMNLLMQRMPHRCFDVGIAEGHAVTFSAGLAREGLVPFCNIYSSFMQRAFDNVVHDVALQGAPVVLCLDRSGLVGEDGATHHGALDLSYFGAVPGLIIAAPADERELRNLMYTALHAGRPFVLRYPRGRGPGVLWRGTAFEQVAIGQGRQLRQGERIAVLTLGPAAVWAAEALDRVAPDGIRAAHYDLRYAKPLDEELLREVARAYRGVVTVEDGAVRGGTGSAVAERLADYGFTGPIRHLGIPDRVIEHGTPEELRALCGYDTAGIARALKALDRELSPLPDVAPRA